MRPTRWTCLSRLELKPRLSVNVSTTGLYQLRRSARNCRRRWTALARMPLTRSISASATAASRVTGTGFLPRTSRPLTAHSPHCSSSNCPNRLQTQPLSRLLISTRSLTHCLWKMKKRSSVRYPGRSVRPRMTPWMNSTFWALQALKAAMLLRRLWRQPGTSCRQAKTRSRNSLRRSRCLTMTCSVMMPWKPSTD